MRSRLLKTSLSALAGLAITFGAALPIQSAHAAPICTDATKIELIKVRYNPTKPNSKRHKAILEDDDLNLKAGNNCVRVALVPISNPMNPGEFILPPGVSFEDVDVRKGSYNNKPEYPKKPSDLIQSYVLNDAAGGKVYFEFKLPSGNGAAYYTFTIKSVGAPDSGISASGVVEN